MHVYESDTLVFDIEIMIYALCPVVQHLISFKLVINWIFKSPWFSENSYKLSKWMGVWLLETLKIDLYLG